MKLDYKILWIDNDIDTYVDNNTVSELEDFLIETGFTPQIKTVSDESVLDRYLNEKYDLIISDFNLNKENGDVVIYRLRNEKRIDTEILFYSARSDFLSDDEVKNRLAFMERINIHQGRGSELIDKIEKVIKLTIGKLLSLNATRGLIMSETSELDLEIKFITFWLIEKSSKTAAELHKIVEKKVYKPLMDSYGKFWPDYDELGFEDCYDRIDAYKRWGIFRHLLKEIKTEKGVKDFLDNNADYYEKIIKPRNLFAHVKPQKNDNGIEVLEGFSGKDKIDFTTDSCIQIRKDILKHRGFISDLKKELNID